MQPLKSLSGSQNDAPVRRRRRAMPRISRTEPGHLEESDAHLWAVSYSDLLMVLMSFFVIYFSFDDSNTAGILQIARSMKNETAVAASSQDAAQKNTGAGQVHISAGSSSLFQKQLAALNVKLEKPGSSLLLNFEPDIFESGEFKLSETTEQRISEIVDILKPYQNEIEVVVIGHSDSITLRPRNGYLTDNFDLSSLRALRALQYFVKLGFPVEQISAQGAGDNARNSRTLSLKVQLRGHTS